MPRNDQTYFDSPRSTSSSYRKVHWLPLGLNIFFARKRSHGNCRCETATDASYLEVDPACYILTSSLFFLRQIKECKRFDGIRSAAAAVVAKEINEPEVHTRQRKMEQEEHARQRKKEQEEQAPQARGKYKTFDDRMEDLKRYKETHGHVNVSIPVDKSLAQFCVQTRCTRNNPGKSKSKKLTIENIARLDALGFNWTSQEYVTRSFDERIDDLEKYKRTHGHLSVKIHEDSSLYQFCAGVRHSLKMAEKDGTRKLTVERIARLDALGFEW